MMTANANDRESGIDRITGAQASDETNEEFTAVLPPVPSQSRNKEKKKENNDNDGGEPSSGPSQWPPTATQETFEDTIGKPRNGTGGDERLAKPAQWPPPQSQRENENGENDMSHSSCAGGEGGVGSRGSSWNDGGGGGGGSGNGGNGGGNVGGGSGGGVGSGGVGSGGHGACESGGAESSGRSSSAGGTTANEKDADASEQTSRLPDAAARISALGQGAFEPLSRAQLETYEMGEAPVSIVTAAQDAASLALKAQLLSDTDGTAEQLRTGFVGEYVVFHQLSALLAEQSGETCPFDDDADEETEEKGQHDARSDVWTVEWLNSSAESGAPFDVVCRKFPSGPGGAIAPGGEPIRTVYVEVKTTSTADKHLFEVSTQMLEYARSHPTDYYVCRVYAARMVLLPRIWEQLLRKGAQLYMRI
jgi:hypothetical protein